MTNKTVSSHAKAEAERMRDDVLSALAEAKGEQVRVLDVRNLTDITDYMIVVTGNSQRHVKTLAECVHENMRHLGWKHFGMEGLEQSDWVLVDFVDVVVHIMRAHTREHYSLESLWDETLSEMLQSPRETIQSDARLVQPLG